LGLIEQGIESAIRENELPRRAAGGRALKGCGMPFGVETAAADWPQHAKPAP